MKTKQSILFLTFFTLLSFNSIFAQYGYGNGYGGYGNNGYGGGYGRNSMSQMNQQTPDKPKEIPIEVTVGKIMEKLKPELNLDQLQEIAIANVYTEILRSQGIIMKDEKMSQEDKSKEIKALFEVNERKINEYLNEEQKEKFKALKEERGNNKKDKKKKSKKED